MLSKMRPSILPAVIDASIYSNASIYCLTKRSSWRRRAPKSTATQSWSPLAVSNASIYSYASILYPCRQKCVHLWSLPS